MTTGPVNLLDVLSWEVSDALDHLTGLDRRLSENALLERFGRSLDDVRIELKAIPFDAEAEAEEVQENEHFRRVLRRRDADDDEPADRDERDRRIYGAHGRPRDAQPQPLDRLLAPLRCAAILGDPGGGKTEHLKNSARTAARTAQAALKSAEKPPAEISLPVFLHFRAVAAELGDEKGLLECLGRFGIASATPLADPLRIPAAILRALSRRDTAWAPRLARLLWRQLTTRPGDAGAAALVCLDAWDELREGHVALAKYLGAFVASTGAKVLATSRIAGYVERGAPFPTDDLGHAVLRICPFEQPDTEVFIARFFLRNNREQEIGRRLSGELRTKVPIAGMAENPLLTTLLCMAYWPDPRQKPLALPVRRGELYERILRGLLGEWPGQLVIKERVEGGPSRKGLIAPKLALITAMAQRFFPAQLLTDDDIDEFFWGKRGYFAQGGPAASPAHPLQRLIQATGLSMQDLLCEDGVLVRIGADGFSLLHLTFLEFLTARAFATKPWNKIEGLIDRKSWLAAWEEVIILIAGQLAEPGPLLDLLANPDKDDFLRHRTILTALVLPELTEAARRANEERIARITTILVDRFLDLSQADNKLEEFYARALPALAVVNGRYYDATLLAWIEEQVCARKTDWKFNCDLRGLLLSPVSIWWLEGRVWAYILGKKSRTLNLERLPRFGATAATPGILKAVACLLASPESSLRMNAAKAVERLGQAAATASVLTGLARALLDEDRDVRHAAAKTLGSLGPAAATPEHLAVLQRLLSDGDSSVKFAAMEALGRLGAAAATLEHLAVLSCLFADDSRVRSAALQAVGSLGPAAATPEILAALKSLLADNVSDVRSHTAFAIGRLGATAAVPEIMETFRHLLVDDDRSVRVNAAEALGRLGAAAATRENLAVLRCMLATGPPRFTFTAMEAAARLGPAAATREILGTLEGLVADPNGAISAVAAKTLGSLGTAAATSQHLTGLKRLLSDGDRSVKFAAVEALGRLGTAAATPEILAALRGLLARRGSIGEAARASLLEGRKAFRVAEALGDFRGKRVSRILVRLPNLRAFNHKSGWRKSGWIIRSVEDLDQ